MNTVGGNSITRFPTIKLNTLIKKIHEKIVGGNSFTSFPTDNLNTLVKNFHEWIR